MDSWIYVEAYTAGYKANLAAQAIVTCPHATSSPQYGVWREGWVDAHRRTPSRGPGTEGTALP